MVDFQLTISAVPLKKLIQADHQPMLLSHLIIKIIAFIQIALG